MEISTIGSVQCGTTHVTVYDSSHPKFDKFIQMSCVWYFEHDYAYNKDNDKFAYV